MFCGKTNLTVRRFSEEAINEKPQDLSSKSAALASIPLPPEVPQTARPQIIVSPRKSENTLDSASLEVVRYSLYLKTFICLPCYE